MRNVHDPRLAEAEVEDAAIDIRNRDKEEIWTHDAMSANKAHMGIIGSKQSSQSTAQLKEIQRVMARRTGSVRSMRTGRLREVLNISASEARSNSSLLWYRSSPVVLRNLAALRERRTEARVSSRTKGMKMAKAPLMAKRAQLT